MLFLLAVRPAGRCRGQHVARRLMSVRLSVACAPITWCGRRMIDTRKLQDWRERPPVLQFAQLVGSSASAGAAFGKKKGARSKSIDAADLVAAADYASLLRSLPRAFINCSLPLPFPETFAGREILRRAPEFSPERTWSNKSGRALAKRKCSLSLARAEFCPADSAASSGADARCLSSSGARAPPLALVTSPDRR